MIAPMGKPTHLWIAGASTVTGQALSRLAAADPAWTLVDGAHVNLADPAAVDGFLEQVQPEAVVVSGGDHAGIGGNLRRPADLMTNNLLIAAGVIPAAHRHGVRRLLYLGSSCIYPRAAAQPFAPDALWTGPVEPTSAAYATAKLAGVRMVSAYRAQHHVAFISAVAADVYGPGDDFSPDDSHVVAALIRRAEDARTTGAASLSIWGSGTPRREFIYADDLASACLFVLKNYDADEPINLGTGETTSIAELAEIICDVVGFRGKLEFDTSKPDGVPLKGLDSSRLRDLGWRPSTELRDALAKTVDWYRAAAGKSD